MTVRLQTSDELSHPSEERHTSPFPFNRRVYITVQRYLNAAVSEYLGKRLGIKSERNTVCSKCMAQAVEVD